MSEEWPDLFVVAGPTAAGKSTLAVEFALNWNAEIVSADACQIYRGLGMLTAQPTVEQRTRVAHHLVEMLEPVEELSAADFARLARAAIEEIRRRNKRIVVVGGAGFYLEALLDGLPETPPPNEALRRRLRDLALPELVAELQRIDPAAAQTIDLENPRRLQRAIEIVTATGRPFASFALPRRSSVKGLVLHLPRPLLQQRIEQRTRAMLANGAIEEVRRLGPRSTTCGKSIGLAAIAKLLSGRISRTACEEQINIATRQYAKRQMTWFRNRARWPLVSPEDAARYADSAWPPSL